MWRVLALRFVLMRTAKGAAGRGGSGGGGGSAAAGSGASTGAGALPLAACASSDAAAAAGAPAAAIVLAWPCALPVPTQAQEQHLRGVLLPECRRAVKAEPITYEDLPLARRSAIEAAAARVGVRLFQAVSLRAQLRRSAAPFLFAGTEAAALAAATRFEDSVEARLRAGGCTQYETQAQQVRRLHAAGATATATPDFLLLAQPVTIQGVTCHWLEVKRFYAMGMFEELRDWAPTRKSLAQLAKYVAAFGQGAVVFSLGFSERYRASAPPGVLLLDGSPWEAAAEFSDLFTVEIK